MPGKNCRVVLGVDTPARGAYREAMNVFLFLRHSVPVIGICAVLAAVSAVPVSAGTVALASHQAVYDIHLHRAGAGAGVVAAGGRAFYRVERGCDGWQVENRTSLLLTYEGDQTVKQVWSQASWESEDGRSFRSRVAEYRPDGSAERITSRARLGPEGGTALFTEPEDIERALPAQTRFPMAHLQELLDIAAGGGGHLRRVLFDGGNTDNPYTVNVAVLGPADAQSAEAVRKRFDLLATSGWRMHMAFFPFGGRTATPDYEVTGTFRADGIVYELLQDFGTFSLSLTLRELELFGKPDC